VGVVAAAGMTLACDWLPSWIDAAHVRADRATHAFGVTRPIGIQDQATFAAMLDRELLHVPR
jgi:hypothetical protein